MTDRERLFAIATGEPRADLFVAFLSGFFANDEYILGKLSEAIDSWDARQARMARYA